jgi:hypothetical protein
VGERATQPQQKPHIHQSLCLYETAREAVQHAAQTREAAQGQDYLIQALPGMENDGQSQLPRHGELSRETGPLVGSVRRPITRIEPDFPQGDGLRQEGGQSRFPSAIPIIQIEGMYAIGRIKSGVMTTGFLEPAPMLRGIGRDDDLADACRLCTAQNRITIVVEGGIIQVTMAVYQTMHRQLRDIFCARSKRRHPLILR